MLPDHNSHTVADIFNFSYWWTDVAGSFDKRPITESGIDTHFAGWTVVFVASLALFFVATGKVRVARQAEGN